MKIDLYSQDGTKKGDITINDKMFGIEKINHDLIHKALVLQQANRRVAIAHTKKRDDVSGGGKKPYRQKGTGRARQGSIRSPQFKGGGIVFGPSNIRNFKKDMPKKQRRAALFHTLSAKAKDAEILALESYDSTEIKTKPFAEMLSKLPVEKNVLIVIPEKNNIVAKSANNIKGAKTLLVNYLNVEDLLKYKQVLFFKKALGKAEKIFLS